MKKSPLLSGLLGILCSTLLPNLACAQTVVYTDSFDSNKGWPDSDVTNDLSAVYTIVNGEYLISPLLNDTYGIAIAPAAIDSADVVIESDVRLAASQPESRLGIACRAGAGLTFYAFTLSAKGTYEIIRVQDGKGTLLTSGAFGGKASEGARMRAECIGSRLTLKVDGQELGQATDSVLNGAGKVGLLSVSPVVAATNAAFDNLSVAVSGGAPSAPTAATVQPDSGAGKPAASESSGGGGSDSGAASLPELEDAAFYNDAGGTPGERQSLFNAGENRVYVVLELSSKAKAKYRAQWKAAKGTEESNLMTSEHENSSDRGRVWLYAERNWTPGLYEVDVYANDRLLTKMEFSVVE